MNGTRRFRHRARRLGPFLAASVIVVLAAVAGLVLVIQTSWARNQLRALIVREASHYLTARLEVGRIQGSIFSDVTLRDVRLRRDGRTLVAIDAVTIAYNLREIWSHGAAIDRIELISPRIAATLRPDGRWDLATLVKRNTQQAGRKGPGRSVHIGRLRIDDGTIVLGGPVAFGAAHIPTRYEHLNARLGVDYAPARWTLRIDSMSWLGADPGVAIESLTGSLGNGPDGFSFDRVAVRTPTTAFTLSGTIHRNPSRLDLSAHAVRFRFQEWAGILPGLAHIAVDSSLDVALHGPLTALRADLDLRSTAGAIAGRLTLNTRVPGWRGVGGLDLRALNLAGWLNRPDRWSDITGHVVFELALRLGEGFPRGRFEFRGAHAGFMEYAADAVEAGGDIDASEVVVRAATARAYGARETVAGAIGIADPYPFRFKGAIAGLDLRRLPKPVPVPHVASALTFDYVVRGRFARPYIAGRARLARSTFLGAVVAAGTVGRVDTLAQPIRYGGEGAIAGVDLGRFGRALDITTLRQPRYQGRVAGRFHLTASGTTSADLDLHASGRVARAEIFDGTLTDADVSLDIAGGTLAASYHGRFDRIDPAAPLLDPRFEASLSGTGRVAVTVRDLMRRPPEPSDYRFDWDLTFGPGTVHGIQVDRAHAAGTFRDALTTLTAFDARGPLATVAGGGTIALTDTGVSDFRLTVQTADLARAGRLFATSLGGRLTGRAHLTGPRARPHVSGTATAIDLAARGVSALDATGTYDIDLAAGDLLATSARLAGAADFVSFAGRTLARAAGTVALAGRQIALDATATGARARTAAFRGEISVAADRHSFALEQLAIDVGGHWELARTAVPPVIAWNARRVAVTPLDLVGGTTGRERIDVGGTWRFAGASDLHVSAERIRLESLAGIAGPVRYGGTLNADIVVRGTRARPIVTGALLVARGRVDRLQYRKLEAHVGYANGAFTIDARLDQAPGTWATANGTVPFALFDRTLPEAPIDLRIQTSPIDLGLLNGVTGVVTNLSGAMTANVHVIGTSRDPHFEGRVDVTQAAFLVAETGVAYTRVSAAVALARDRITVESLHVEDTDHHALDVRGSLGTHELKVGHLEISATARDFAVLRNGIGTVAVDAALDLTGRFESPRLEGSVTLAGSTLNVDEILDRTLFQPYSTQQAPIAAGIDPIAALNPWDRLRVDLTLHVPGTLQLRGQDIQVSSGAPFGIGDVTLRVGGNLSLQKNPGRPLAVYGSFDRLSGAYAFQGRRFQVLPASSITFRGALAPDLYVRVARNISGVEAAVTISGPITKPALRLSSDPPLEPTDILSLIVFNASANDLNASQQQQLAVRAGALAAGFVATPLVSALESRLGLETLEISPSGDFGSMGPKVTVGEELAPGLFARFSRQFGYAEYDELQIEYYLTPFLHLRADFSDASDLAQREPFLLVERGGVDLLMFFSF